MSKADTIRLMHSERCSIAEMVEVVRWYPCDVRRFIRLWIE